MHILITGVSGQIGTNLALRCIADGHQVFGIDKRPNSWTTDITQCRLDLTAYDARLRITESLLDWGRPDVAIHLAAHAKVHELVLEPLKALENICMAQQVLEYCRTNNVPIIFSSSREVYGDIYRLKTFEQDVDFTLVASSYAASKLSAEALIYSYQRCYGLPYIIFRLSNVYGRYDNDLTRMERVISVFIKNIRKRETLTVFGRNKILDFTYIDDCIDGIMLGINALVAGTLANQTFNLAKGEGHTLEQLCHCLAEILDTDIRIKYLPAQRGEISRYVAALDKAKKMLGFSPKVSLMEGICKTIAWADEESNKERVTRINSTSNFFNRSFGDKPRDGPRALQK